MQRRSGNERRDKPGLPRLFRSQGRRLSAGRREQEAGGYIDRYDGRTWLVALSVLLLSVLDAVLTALQISAGLAEEANPIMHHLLRVGGPWGFFGAKAATTSLAMAVIVLHREWRIGRVAARTCLWAYIAVCTYHLVLILGRTNPSDVGTI